MHPFLSALLLTLAPQAAPASGGEAAAVTATEATTEATTEAATVAGTVRDAATGSPVVAAVVSLPDLGREALTGPDGAYAIPGVPAGPQHLVVERLGYRGRTAHLLVPRAGRLSFDVTLAPRPVPLGGLATPRGPPPRGLDPGDSTGYPDRGVTRAGLRGHPTLAQPDAVLALAGGEATAEPESPTGLAIRGGAADHTGYLLDGVPVLSPYHAAGLFSAWNPDALEALRLDAAAPSPALPDALSGAVVARTLDPAGRLRGRATASNTGAGLTLDGPVGSTPASASGPASAPASAPGPGRASPAGAWLVAWRVGFPGWISPPAEGSYLGAKTGDVVAAVRLPAAGGRLRLLLYDAENEVEAAATVPEEGDVAPGAPRHAFAWGGRSLGASWSRGGLRLGAWRATGVASAAWRDPAGAAALDAERADVGGSIVVSLGAGADPADPADTAAGASGPATEVGVRVRRLDTSYRGGAWSAAGATTVWTGFAGHGRRLTETVDGWVGAAVSLAGGRARVAPRARLRWRPASRAEWTLAYGRTHQFAQSLRNAESPAGHLFPAEPSLAAGVAGVPVPRSDQLVAAVAWWPAAGLRLGAQGFVRAMDGLALVAPVEDGPFATAGFVTGSAVARGASLEASARGARFGAVASYGWQRVRVSADDDAAAGDPGDATPPAWAPRAGAAHTLTAGVAAYPTPTLTLRLAARATAGRSATALAGSFEWETCNALDRGCEFAGSPRLDGDPGGVRLPAYARVDAGIRKHWHLRAGGRDVRIGVFGTLTNLLGRFNTLDLVTDPDTGRRAAVQMLSRSPLVVGLDARF